MDPYRKFPRMLRPLVSFKVTGMFAGMLKTICLCLNCSRLTFCFFFCFFFLFSSVFRIIAQSVDKYVEVTRELCISKSEDFFAMWCICRLHGRTLEVFHSPYAGGTVTQILLSNLTPTPNHKPIIPNK